MRRPPLRDQVTVITGASSGIGRECALMLADAGARVVLLAREEQALATVVDEITERGGTARHIVCDVTDAAQLEAAAARTEEWFGGIDTWVNNAGVLLYGEFWNTPPDEFQRVMEVNYLGQVHGALAALPALERSGGTLVAIASAESFLTLPLHSAYAASKAAVSAAMDGLRRDLIAHRIPVNVTTVFPAVIDTPIYRTARNHMDVEPSAPPPYYDPVVVARCVLFAATHRVRNLYAGGASRGMSMLQALAPAAADRLFGRVGMPMLRTEQPETDPAGNLEVAHDLARSRGGLPRAGRRVSSYTWLATHRPARWGLTAAALLGAGMLLGRRRSR